jgi:hypothetical protein
MRLRGAEAGGLRQRMGDARSDVVLNPKQRAKRIAMAMGLCRPCSWPCSCLAPGIAPRSVVLAGGVGNAMGTYR